MSQFKSCLHISHVGFIDTLCMEDLSGLYVGVWDDTTGGFYQPV